MDCVAGTPIDAQRVLHGSLKFSGVHYLWTTFVGCLGWVRVYRRVGLVCWCIYTLWDERVVYDDLGLAFGFT